MAAVDAIGDRICRRSSASRNQEWRRNIMLHRISNLAQLERKTLVRITVSVLFVLSLGCSPAPIFAQETRHRTFASAEDASRALFEAMQSQDEQAPLSMLGPAGKEVVSSGDPQEDLDARTGFVVKYQEMHRFVTEPSGTVTLVVGAENWPFPIPLLKKNGSWYFAKAAGKDEIIFRRIGKNELSAMDACRDLVDAQNSILPARRLAYPANSLRNLSAKKASTMVCTGAVLTMSSTVRSTLSSLTRAKISQRTRLASMFRSMGTCSGSLPAKDHMRRAVRKTTLSMAR